MGLIKAINDIITKMKSQGKSKTEIAEIINEASAKATVNIPENEKKPEKVVAKKQESLIEAIHKAGISTEDAARAFSLMNRAQERAKRQQSNNWRKMHGIPMHRRLRNGSRGRKANDDSKNTDVS